MDNYVFKDNHIELLALPKNLKKITGTRFAAVLGLNPYKTPFSTWCELTRTYQEPFEETIYTNAGKIIEPLICDYLRERFFIDIKSPTDVYGPDYFKKTWGDFFGNLDVFGGMWDYLGEDFVVEVKTTKKVEDWKDENDKVEPPIYYKLQACLYAYLLGFDKVTMTCTFLEEKDYIKPEDFEPNLRNTIIHNFKISEEFPDFKESYINPALEFWHDHVLTGISPNFDEKRDASILKELRKNTIKPSDDEINDMIREADDLQARIDEVERVHKDIRKRLNELDESIKQHLSEQFRDGDKYVEVVGDKYIWVVTKSERKSLDQKALKGDYPEVFSKYVKKSETYSLRKSALDENSIQTGDVKHAN